MSKKKKLFLFLVAIMTLAMVFYFTNIKSLTSGYFNSLSLGMARVDKEILYAAQVYLPLRKSFDVELKVLFHKQEHALSCEIATLKMVLDYYGVPASENDLLRSLPFDTTEARNPENIWGDPDVGFVGDINGKIPNSGYGVYENPIVNLALQYRDAKKIKDATLADVLNEVDQKHPVIVWGSVGSGQDISWLTQNGKYVKAVWGEHTRIIIGYSGTPENPKYILLMDPVYGKVVMSKNRFLTNWGLLGNKAVVVY